ncbi:MAG: hypothetical protein HY273_11875 [Gammaproteobacteria bacterium]|nr:hypothetical protein [Gammaproteobacteria bacterium]
MNKSILNKLLLSRSLYYLAKENAASASGNRLSIACNLLQDSVECFLLALSEYVNAGIGQRTDFDKYFEQINLKIVPRELPFRLRLIALNKLRVNSKHYGLEPAKAELEPLLMTVLEFFNEVTRIDFGREFATISLVDILHDGEAKDLLRQAESAYESQEYGQCLIRCREAVFVRFESRYDAQPFKNRSNTFGLTLGSKVPYFARDQKYIEEYVKEPTDYVIYDHNSIEMVLMKSGVDSVAYWNVWRLTPDVYRKSKDTSWIVKNDLPKLDTEGIRDRAEYVLLATTEMLLAADQNQSRTRSTDYRRFYLTLNRDAVPVYSKASKLSPIEQTTPAGIRKLFCDFSIESLDGSGTFWHITHYEEGANVYGFVHEDEIDN